MQQRLPKTIIIRNNTVRVTHANFQSVYHVNQLANPVSSLLAPQTINFQTVCRDDNNNVSQ